ncbi:MAG: NAD(+)/NADH kinase [Arenicellales bacterium]|jgi:NAD+ kinase|nr:NAD(+)/NADH kinase [Arenicellales bacterium]MDP7452169.1 NAD(+)/NADH kinase [Arenicellales bacterium]MDP7617432.1 NAD(+)/NADH kinase [Arenicellales bacterium]
MQISSVGLFGRYKDPDVSSALDAVRKHLENRDISVYIGDTTADNITGTRIEDSGLPVGETIDLAVVVGGDGTMLHVARGLASYALPMIGINLGRLGFLTDLSADRMHEGMDELLRGEFTVEERIMLQVQISNGRDNLNESVALNDVTLSKGNTGRMIEFDTRVNSEPLGRTRGDGVIISTPTGSTAYALSAGGPILHPLLPAIVFAPICPHTLGHRPMVLDDSSIIELEILDLAGADGNVFIDGLKQLAVSGNEIIRISRAETVTRMVRINSHNHFTALRSKLGWG